MFCFGQQRIQGYADVKDQASLNEDQKRAVQSKPTLEATIKELQDVVKLLEVGLYAIAPLRCLPTKCSHDYSKMKLNKTSTLLPVPLKKRSESSPESALLRTRQRSVCLSTQNDVYFHYSHSVWV